MTELVKKKAMEKVWHLHTLLQAVNKIDLNISLISIQQQLFSLHHI